MDIMLFESESSMLYIYQTNWMCTLITIRHNKITFWTSMGRQNKGFYQLADEPKGEECTDVSCSKYEWILFLTFVHLEC